MDIHTTKEHYSSRTPSCSKERGSHSHMYSEFYSSDIVQRKHCPRSLSRLPIHSRKDCYKLSDTSPQKPCETSQSQSPYHSQSCSTDSMDIHTTKEHYRVRTPSRSKERGSHSHMYSGFYSSDIVQRKHRPRSLSHLPIHSRKNCYKLSDTSPQKPCETSQSQSPYRSRRRKSHKCIDTSPNKEYETSQS